MRRVVVIGNTGSGKSTLAADLAGRRGAPHVDLDDLFWNPGWIESDDDTFRARVAAATQGDDWIVSGNYLSKVATALWPCADTIVWLDLPLPLVISRSVRRTIRRGVTKEVVCNGNTEKARFVLPERFTGEKPLWSYALRHHKEHRPIIEAMLAEPTVTADVHRLRSRAEVARFLVEILRQTPS